MRVLEHVRGGTGDWKILYIVSIMLFFWAICDSIMSFVAPLIIVEHGISATVMGIIIGSSSIAGAFLDFFLCRLLPNTNFRRVFAGTIIVSAFFPLFMWKGTTIWMFLMAMAAWGLYYDFYRIGTYDFVSRLSSKVDYSTYFGQIQVFIALGVLLAPFIAEFLIDGTVGASPIIAALIFLGFAGAMYVLLLRETRGVKHYTEVRPRPSVGLLRELRIWRKLEKKIFPVLLVSLTLSMMNAFYWTIGPLFANSLTGLGHFSGLFLASFLAPSLIVGWFIGRITARYEQKKTAVVALFTGSLILLTLGFVANEFLLVAINFIASIFITAAYPAIDGAYTNFIAEAKEIETEIETIEDSSVNLGWVIGPVLAGVISDMVGYQFTFVVLGALGTLIAIWVWRIMPRTLHVSRLI